MKRNGFTLIELIVIIVVLAIIFLLAAPRFIDYTDRATLTKIVNDIKVSEDASGKYYLKNDYLPIDYETPYSNTDLNYWVDTFVDKTGKKVELEPLESYYEIKWDDVKTLSTKPDNHFKYIIQGSEESNNNDGMVLYAYELTTAGKESRIAGVIPPPNNIPIAAINTLPAGLLDTDTIVSFSSENSSDLDDDELISYWSIDGGPETTTPPDGKFSVGSHTVTLRVYDMKNYSDIISYQFSVMPVSTMFNNIYGGNGTEYPSSIINTFDGNHIVAGYTFSSANGDVTSINKGGYDIWVLKFDDYGNKIWNKNYGGRVTEMASVIIETTDHGFIISGKTESNASGDVTTGTKGNTDVWVLKLDSAGNKLWNKTYGSTGYEEGYDIKQTDDGYIIVGMTGSDAGGDVTTGVKGLHDVWVLKLDNIGNKMWDKTYGGSNIDLAYAVEIVSDGYIVAGHTTSSANGDVTGVSNGSADLWLLKLDFYGNKIWDKNYGGMSSDYTFSFKKTPGGFIFGGYTQSPKSGDVSNNNKGGRDFWILNLDDEGRKIWDKTYGGTGLDTAHSIINTSDGGYLVLGCTQSPANIDITTGTKGKDDVLIFKLNALGNKMWSQTYGSNETDCASDAVQTADGGYLIAAATYSSNSGDILTTSHGSGEFWILKLNGFGAYR